MAEATQVPDGVVADFIAAALEASRKAMFEIAYDSDRETSKSEPAKKSAEKIDQAQQK